MKLTEPMLAVNETVPPEHTTVLALLKIVGTAGTIGTETNVAEAIGLKHAFASFWIIL